MWGLGVKYCSARGETEWQAGSGGTVMGRLRVDPERNVVLQEVVLPISAVKVLCTARCALARGCRLRTQCLFHVFRSYEFPVLMFRRSLVIINVNAPSSKLHAATKVTCLPCAGLEDSKAQGAPFHLRSQRQLAPYLDSGAHEPRSSVDSQWM